MTVEDHCLNDDLELTANQGIGVLHDISRPD